MRCAVAMEAGVIAGRWERRIAAGDESGRDGLGLGWLLMDVTRETVALETRTAASERSLDVGRAAFGWLGGIATVLVVFSGLLYVLVVRTGMEQSSWVTLWRMFDVSSEVNVPTWFSSGLWLLLAVAAVVVSAHAPRPGSWRLLAVIAAYASVDEAASIHEKSYRLGSLLTPYLPVDIFSYRWVIFGVVAALVVVLLLAPLMWTLPWRIMAGYVVAGTTFLLGAVVLETVGGFVERHFGQVTWHLMLLIQVEELLEMLGVALAVACTVSMIRFSRTEDGIRSAYAGDRRGRRRGR